jgi:hypothetical protein
MDVVKEFKSSIINSVDPLLNYRQPQCKLTIRNTHYPDIQVNATIVVVRNLHSNRASHLIDLVPMSYPHYSWEAPGYEDGASKPCQD